jgi:hypothetical protein
MRREVYTLRILAWASRPCISRGIPSHQQTSGVLRKILSSSMRNEHPHTFDKGTRMPGLEEIRYGRSAHKSGVHFLERALP